jgi:hypothetical protein
MKTIFLTAAAIAALSLASCKKDYTCECTTTSPAGTSTSSEKTGKMKLSDAKSKCNEGDKTYTVLGETYETECSIK